MTNTEKLTDLQAFDTYDESASINIYVTNLNLYNQGLLYGCWVSLPKDSDELEEVINAVSRGGEDEIFITDYESEFFSIGEYDDIAELNEKAEQLDECDDLDAVAAALEFTDDIDEAEEMAEDCIQIDRPAFSFSSDNYIIGEFFAEELGAVELPENIAPYFDYEAYGRDISYDYHTTEKDGVIYLFNL